MRGWYQDSLLVMEGTEAQVIFSLSSIRRFVAQHSTHVTDELRRLTAPPAVTEVPDIVHEVSVNVDEYLEYIAPPDCISENDRCKQPSQQYTANQQLACLLFLHRHTQALTASCNAGGVIDDHGNK